MRFIITGRNIEVTAALNSKVQEKLSKLEKYFDANTQVMVTLRVEKLKHIVEVTIPIKGSVIRAEVETQDMYAALDEIVDIVERQLKRHKNKLRDKIRNDLNFKRDYVESLFEVEDDDSIEEDINIVRTKKVPLKPMHAEEACLEMDLLGHDFFVFTNGDTGEINVVYKRKKEGTYGLIEPGI